MAGDAARGQQERPSLEDVRAVAQPPDLVARRSAEHWAGRLYMRRISIRLTRLLADAPVTPNGLTFLMIVVGLGAAAILGVPGLWTAVLAAVLIQGYLLLDCVDGEVARWRGVTSAAGVYLDRLGHHVVEAALVIGLGIRAAGGGRAALSWWLVIGALGALIVVIGKLESDLVTVARASAGLPTSQEEDPVSRVGSVRRLRRLFDLVPVHRLVGAVELSLLAVAAAIIDNVTASLTATQGLLLAVVAVAVLVAIGHPITILTSRRLR